MDRKRGASAAFPAGDFDAMRLIAPRGYVCYRARRPVTISGCLDDPAWERAPWTALFTDIEGDRKPAPRFATRAKLLFDDRFLYAAAVLEEPHVWATLKERNSIVFRDNDFEVFIDPDGDNHNYYELEINPFGTLFELALPKPYKDGGQAIHGSNMPGLQAAVHVDGTLNDPRDRDRGWSVELAFPWEGLKRYSGAAGPPGHGEQWRVNFSRVEWRHEAAGGRYEKVPGAPEDNWVWSPQGIVDMHRPERWGFLQFSEAEAGTDAFRPDPAFPGRELLMEVYHRQRAYRAGHGACAGSAEEIGLAAEAQAGPARLVSMALTPAGFEAKAEVALPGGRVAVLAVDHESRLKVL